MSSTASRQRQRQRRRARENLWQAQQELAERQVDLVSYMRVIASMTAQGLPAETRAPLVLKCRDATQRDCERLEKLVHDRKRAVDALEPVQSPSDPKETLSL